MLTESTLTRDHIKVWLLLLLRGCAAAGLSPVRGQFVHRALFLSNSFAKLYDKVAPSEFVLKRDRGAFYPAAQFELERFAAQGLVALLNTSWSTLDEAPEAEFELTPSGRSLTEKFCAASSWCEEVQSYLTDLCVSIAKVDDGHEVATMDCDLTYDQDRAGSYPVIAFRHPVDRLSERAVEELESLSPPGLKPNRQHQLGLYLKYLERIAA